MSGQDDPPLLIEKRGQFLGGAHRRLAGGPPAEVGGCSTGEGSSALERSDPLVLPVPPGSDHEVRPVPGPHDGEERAGIRPDDGESLRRRKHEVEDAQPAGEAQGCTSHQRPQRLNGGLGRVRVCALAGLLGEA